MKEFNNRLIGKAVRYGGPLALALVLAGCSGEQEPVPAPATSIPATPDAPSPIPVETVQPPTPEPELIPGIIGLTEDNKAELIALIQTDAEAAERFEGIRNAANEALSTEPQPLQYIHVEGSHPQEERQVSAEAVKDSDKMYHLALAATVTGEQQYTDAAKEYVMAWATTNQSEGNPIDDTKLDRMWIAYDLIKESMTDEERETVMRWADQVAQAHMTIELRDAVKVNNWQNHRLKILGMAGYVTGNRTYVEAALNGFQEQASGFLNADGSTYDFVERDALRYQTYGLAPLLDLARVSELNGQPIFDYQNAQGGSIRHSLNFILPFVRGQMEHLEFVNTTVESDRNRTDYGTPWPASDAVRVLETAMIFDPAYAADLALAKGQGESKYPTFGAVIADVYNNN